MIAKRATCLQPLGFPAPPDAFPILKRKVRWSVQLNVNNVLDQRELIVNNTHPRTLAPITYRYQDPRQFILTNTFSF